MTKKLYLNRFHKVLQVKPVLEYLPRAAKESFVVASFDYEYYPTPWHYHPEYELVLVTESRGKRFIGDNISDFEPGNLAFIGPNLPHTYKNDQAYYKQESSLRAKSIVVHFLEESLGKDFLDLPECDNLQKLLVRSRSGLHITGEANKMVSRKLKDMLAVSGLKRWILLVDILHILSDTTEYSIISNDTIKGHHPKDNERLSIVIDTLIDSFQDDISLEEVALKVNMSSESLSRYFKQRTRKTFSQFLLELRLSHACKLLQQNEMSVAEICYNSGYNNLSNFNRQFKAHYKISPKQFRKQFEKQDFNRPTL